MEVGELLSVLVDVQIFGTDYSTLELSSIVNDTRKVTENGSFIAIKGENFDGHDALDDVIKAGAKLLIVEKLPENWKELANITKRVEE